MNRVKDWLEQAKRDLKAAKDSQEHTNFEWACFQSQQSAEKSLKSLLLMFNVDAWGHSLIHLFERIKNEIVDVPSYDPDFLDSIFTMCQELDKQYIQPRYPNNFSSGYPAQYYNKKNSQECINYAENIFSYVEEEINKVSSSE